RVAGRRGVAHRGPGADDPRQRGRLRAGGPAHADPAECRYRAPRRPDRGPRAGARMNWVTRERPKTDRIACPWLIRRFIDPDAEILYVRADDVLDVASREGARSFDAPGAEFTHRDGMCSFEVL